MNNFPKLRSLKMLQEHLAATTETTSTASSKNYAVSLEQNFQLLDLRSGQNAARFWGTISQSPGDYLMLNFGESPSVDVESTLSQILEDNVPEKYYLSPKACAGILHRAQRRGKDLPPRLKAALEFQAGINTETNPKTTTLESITNKPIAFEPGAMSRLGGHTWEDKTGTLLSQMGDNQMSVCAKQTVYGIYSDSSNSMKSWNPNSGIYKTEKSKIIDTNGLNPSCKQGGNLVVEEPVYCIQGNCIDRADTAGCNGKGWREDVCYTLTAMDRPAVSYEITPQSKGADTSYVAAFPYQIGGGCSFLPYEESKCPTLLSSQKMAVLIDNHPADSRVTLAKDGVCQTLSARMGTGGGNVPLVMETTNECYSQSGFADYKPHFVVRRLTPLECERLQGFPDNWTASESDSARYKALGNSVALPCVDYVMSGIVDAL